MGDFVSDADFCCDTAVHVPGLPDVFSFYSVRWRFVIRLLGGMPLPRSVLCAGLCCACVASCLF